MKYVRFSIRGKLNRTVTVLLHVDLLQCCQQLVEHRLSVGVHPKNPYLFGICGQLKGDYKYLRACELIRKFSEECGALSPHLLRGTILRKHIATMCVNFNLNENQVSDLAGFLGHHEKIHKEIYRQPIVAREILHIYMLETIQGKDDSGSDSDISEYEDISELVEEDRASTSYEPINPVSNEVGAHSSNDESFVRTTLKKTMK